MVEGDFAAFLTAFPPLDRQPLDAEALAADVESAFGVQVPTALMSFWREVGCGSFADGELHFFGSDKIAGRESLVTWNQSPFWGMWL